jgi:ubiquinone/menaquinone biosynthesis C-methylase UbiE
MISPQDKQKEIIHDRAIKENAEFFWGWATTAGKLRAKRRSERIIEEIKRRNLNKILEIGSGTGVFTACFCSANLDVSGIDISWELLRKAKEKCRGYKALHLSVADVEHLPYHNEAFDAVVGICVLHHLNVAEALAEIQRVLRTNGIILFSEPNMLNPQLFIQKNVKPLKRLPILGETEDETAFYKWQLKAVLEGMGFREVQLEPFDFLHPWTPRFLISSIIRVGTYLEKTPLLREIAGSLFICAVK